MNEFYASLESSETNPKPRITPYLPKAVPEAGDVPGNGIGLLVFPGGGYANLAEHEGMGYADFYTSHGITCFVVEYRLGSEGHRHPAMIEDALAAMTTVRRRCADFGVVPERIGVIGSSAGGHLAAHLLTAWDRVGLEARPDYGVLCYPVIEMTGAAAHTGSRTNLLGESPAAEALEEADVHKRVNSSTPPCFIWHTAEDAAVPVANSFSFAAALDAHKVPFELHVYENGRHGLGLGTPYNWGGESIRWILEHLG